MLIEVKKIVLVPYGNSARMVLSTSDGLYGPDVNGGFVNMSDEEIESLTGPIDEDSEDEDPKGAKKDI